MPTVNVSSLLLYVSAKFCFIAPPAITAIEVAEVCTNDFTVSWTAASNEEGLSYTVTLLPINISVNPAVKSYNFTELMPGTSYDVNIFSRINSCSGMSNTTMFTTLTVVEGVPQSELIVMHCSFGLRMYSVICT